VRCGHSPAGVVDSALLPHAAAEHLIVGGRQALDGGPRNDSARRSREEERVTVQRSPGGTSLIDVLDRILDKGIVIDAWVRISLVGIDLITVEARVVVASIDTYLKYAEAIGITSAASRPVTGPDQPS
jgi:gas vesicle structural protein